MDLNSLKKKLPVAVCLILSAAVSYYSFDYAFSRALSGQDAVIWMALGAFLLSVALVAAAVYFKIKNRV